MTGNKKQINKKGHFNKLEIFRTPILVYLWKLDKFQIWSKNKLNETGDLNTIKKKKKHISTRCCSLNRT